MPPVWLLVAFAAQYFLDRWLPVVDFVPPGLRWLAYPVGLLGLTMIARSVIAFHREATGIVPFDEARTLVTTGFYRVTRNPMYLGMVLLLSAAALHFGTITSFVPVPIFAWVIQRRFIRPEERFLAAVFGERYRRYKARVRRWL